MVIFLGNLFVNCDSSTLVLYHEINDKIDVLRKKKTKEI